MDEVVIDGINGVIFNSSDELFKALIVLPPYNSLTVETCFGRRRIGPFKTGHTTFGMAIMDGRMG